MFTSITDREFCDRVREVLKMNLVNHSEIKKLLEDHFGRSFSSISKRYRRCRRESIFAAFDKIRAKKAKKLLIKKCCFQAQYDLGFRNESYFSKWFRKHTGVNPDVFRKESV